MPSATLEEYLETIYRLSEDGTVRPSAVADSMGVSGPTVTVTLRRLESHGLVSRDGTDVLLTPDGLSKALDIVRRHRVSERFLVDVLGLDWEEAHEEACLLEHALSPRVLEALESFLGEPASCPHGHPIPGSDGTIPPPSRGESLAALPAGSTALVLRVDSGSELLGYLGELGLRPGARVTVTGVEPHDGPLSLTVDGESRVVSRDVARSVEVERA